VFSGHDVAGNEQVQVYEGVALEDGKVLEELTRMLRQP
jgi:hypothetical protein